MPIVRSDDKLIFYAHVPKCGGSAVAWYLQNRFGSVAFHDNFHTRRPKAQRWSMTSPQHIDAGSLSQLFPPGFFDATFTIVRHPVSRLVSAYYFQLEVEHKLSRQMNFSDWLELTVETISEEPFLYDNHVRPMTQIVPEGAQVFYMEHGLDALILWFDALTGRPDGPRAIPEINKRGPQNIKKSGKVTPSPHDLDVIASFYADDFTRFGYSIGQARPDRPAPELSGQFVAERDVELKRMGGLNSSLRGYVDLMRQNLFQRR